MSLINLLYHLRHTLTVWPRGPLLYLPLEIQLHTPFQKYPVHFQNSLIVSILLLESWGISFLMNSGTLSKLYRKKDSFQIVGKLNYHEQLKAACKQCRFLGHKDHKVLIIHTGGTIGMFKNQNGKFAPKKGAFHSFLQNYPYFSDESQTYFIGSDGFTITPQTIFKRKIWYKFHELNELIDSTNMNIETTNHIMQVIKQNYDNFDAFIVTHGTDTMSFTASSLSFMIENLKKTIILTGSQVPMGQTRNDGLNNLLCALTIAGHYLIPEVLLIFDNYIMRGNRTTKSSASSFKAFTSPNYYPIGKMGLKIEINWELIKSCKNDKPTIFHPLNPDKKVGVLKLTPFGIPVQPKTKYVVVQSYGTGNIPIKGPYYQWFIKNSQKDPQQRHVIVNISQVYQSVILNLYATGDMAHKLGLIPGSDMTCEAAVAKLCYLASLNLSYQDIKKQMATNLRGELTQIEDRQAMKKENYVVSCSRMLEKNFMNQTQRFRQIVLYSIITKLIAERSSNASLEHLCCENQIKFDYIFPDGGTLLHQYFRSKRQGFDSVPYLQFLLNQNVIDVNAKDKEQCSALFYALENNHLNQASILADNGAEVHTSSRRVFRAVRNSQLTLLQLMCEFGDDLKYVNQEKRNIFSYAALLDNDKVYELLLGNLSFNEDKFYLYNKDIYGKTPKDYIDMKGWELE